MSDNRTVKVTLVAVAQPYTKGMNEASGATKKLGGDIDSTGDKTKGFGSKVNAAKAALVGMAAAGGALAATRLVQFFNDSIKAAGDLEQSVGGVDAVFKDTAHQVHEFGKNSAENVGLSRNAFNELITVTGALLKNKGLEDFTGKSLQLVQVGADLSATFGGTAKEAVEALNAAMRGESDPIERYGISLNETAVNAELAAKGLNGLEGAALEQAKAQARIDIVMRQSADSMGRFAEEANTLQGQQQRLAAEWENSKAALGEALLPAMTEAVRMMREGVEVGMAIAAAFESVPKPVLAAAAALGAVHLLGGPIGRMGASVATTMSAAREALHYAGDAAARAGGGFAGAAAGVRTFTGVAKPGAAALSGLRSAGAGLLGVMGGPWGLAFVGAATVVTAFWQQQREAKARVDALKDSLDAQTGALTANSDEIFESTLRQSGAIDAAERLGISLALLGDAARGDAESIAELNRQLDATVPAIEAGQRGVTGMQRDARLLTSVIGDTNGMLADARTELEQGERAFGNAGVAAADLGVALGRTGAEAGAAAEAVDHLGRTEEEAAEQTKQLREEHDMLIDALLGVVDAAYAAIAADSAYEAALDNLTDSIKENGKQHDLSTEKGRANMDALTGVAKAARDSARANLENGDSLSEVQREMMSARDAFIKGATQMGMTKAEANALADELGLSASAASTLASSIRGIPSREIKVTTRYVTIGSPPNLGGAARTLVSAQADGGMWEAGRRYMADGGLDDAGRYVPRQSMMGGPAYGKRYITWGEDETHWEGYVSGKPGMESRSKGIASEIVRRLGGQVTWAADGHWSQPRYMPAPAASVAASVSHSPVPAMTQADLDYLIDGITAGVGTAQRDAVELAHRLDLARGR